MNILFLRDSNLKKYFMQTISENALLFTISVLLIGALLGWLIYRNIKDKKEFEKNMNDPKRIIEKHPDEKM